MRRVWRLGQTKPVEVKFLSYRDTLEDLALSLMGKKLYAAQMLYGDEVGGAIVESDDGNFLAELARAAIAQAGVEDLSAMFASANGGISGYANDVVPPQEIMVNVESPPVSIPTVPAQAATMESLRAFVGRPRPRVRATRQSDRSANQLSLLESVG